MASPKIRVLAQDKVPGRKHSRPASPSSSAASRLLEAQRSDGIFPLLLEGIAALGFPRALVAGVDFDSGQVVPPASANLSKSVLRLFRASLKAKTKPLIGVLRRGQPAVLPAGPTQCSLYCHPILFQSGARCPDAERRGAGACLAVENHHRRRKLRLAEQVCSTCGVRAYAALVVVELGPRTAERDLSGLRALVELAERSLFRLFKIEHDCHRIAGMQESIARLEAALRCESGLRHSGTEVEAQYEKLRAAEASVERRMREIERFAATGRLAGTIAHEINNPMEAIKNAIYLLSGKIAPDALPVYNILKAETERVARIVRQMLGLYRSTEQVGHVDVNSVIEDTLLLFSRPLQQSSIRVKADLGTLPPAVGSGDQLRQVLSNLVVNAKDSMEKGGTLHIRTRFMTGAHPLRSFIRILVGDSGSGIPCALQKSVFEPFVSTKGARGTGLGLWIVKGIVESHGGQISLRSRVGRGTVFRIDLPVVR